MSRPRPNVRIEGEILTTGEVARIMGCSPNVVIRLMEKGELRGYKIPGGHRRIRGDDLARFLEEMGFKAKGDNGK